MAIGQYLGVALGAWSFEKKKMNSWIYDLFFFLQIE